MKRRDWKAAREKVDSADSCRVCEATEDLQAAHTIGRIHDEARGKTFYVNPDDIVPLCATCHQRYDARQLSLLSYMTLTEQASAVKHVGIDRAYRRLDAIGYGKKSDGERHGSY